MHDDRVPPHLSDVSRLLVEGRSLQQQGRAADAFARYQSAYKLAPADAEVLHALGAGYAGVGQAAIGVAFVRRAITAAPREPRFRTTLSGLLAEAGQLEAAALEAAAACELAATDVQAHAWLAGLQQRLGHVVEAERSLSKALKLEPSQADWLLALARLQYDRWGMADAMETLRKFQGTEGPHERVNIGWARPTAFSPRKPPTEAVNNLGALSPAELERACVERELMVFDDILEDAVSYRNHAIELCRSQGRREAKLNFPGLQTPPCATEQFMQRVADALGRELRWSSPDHGAFRLSAAADEARADVHVDNPSIGNIFGGVLYLSPPEHSRGGTTFFRHRRTGWDSTPTAERLLEKGYRSLADYQRRELKPNERMSFDAWVAQRGVLWEPVIEVPMRFNRLIIFRSDFYHAVTELFGTTIDNGRLVQLFHFEAEPN
jgi:Flp pilus assembly protein TadD